MLELVHMDVMVLMNPISKGGAQYVHTLVDDNSLDVVACEIKHNSEVAAKLYDVKRFT